MKWEDVTFIFFWETHSGILAIMGPKQKKKLLGMSRKNFSVRGKGQKVTMNNFLDNLRYFET